jgi:hypothetical protein
VRAEDSPTRCQLCGRAFGSRAVVAGRTRYLVETAVRRRGRLVPCCQACQARIEPWHARIARDLERDAAARARAAWREAHPPRPLGSRTHAHPGRVPAPDAFGPDALPAPLGVQVGLPAPARRGAAARGRRTGRPIDAATTEALKGRR